MHRRFIYVESNQIKSNHAPIPQHNILGSDTFHTYLTYLPTLPATLIHTYLFVPRRLVLKKKRERERKIFDLFSSFLFIS